MRKKHVFLHQKYYNNNNSLRPVSLKVPASLRLAFSPNHMWRNVTILTLLVDRKAKEMTPENQKPAHFSSCCFNTEATTTYLHHESHGNFTSMQWAYSAINSVAWERVSRKLRPRKLRPRKLRLRKLRPRKLRPRKTQTPKTQTCPNLNSFQFLSLRNRSKLFRGNTNIEN